MDQSKTIHRDALKAYRTTRISRRFNDDTILKFLEALDCPRSLAVWLLYHNGEHQQLVDLDIEPKWFNDPWKFRDAYTATMLLAKADFLKLEVSKKDAAYTKFWKFEELCKTTNERFKNLSLDPKYHGPNAWLLSATIRKIDSILSPLSSEEFADNAGWGPGVSTLLKGAEVSAFNKFRDERGITRDLYSLVSPWFSMAYPSWSNYATTGFPLDSWLNFEVGNQLVTVPKNSKTDRVIAVEPGLNTWFQKSLGTSIRRRLRREGINLNSQERNQQLAFDASIDDSLATVDFSSASDSVSRELVYCLISDSRWLTLLDKCRSKYGVIDGQAFKWEKFSAMGNGFTFELESLIFYAAAFAVCEYLKLDTRRISVFGDDVILPSDAYSLYLSFCDFLGFRMNPDKSFHDSPFRESCGVHYYDGIDCKPVYLKSRVTNVESLYKLANAIRNLAHRRCFNNGCDARFLECWNSLYGRVPPNIRFGIPQDFGDGGFSLNFDEAVPLVRPKQGRGVIAYPRPAGRGFEGFRFPMIGNLGVTREGDGYAILITRLWQPSVERDFRNEYTLRGTVRTRILTDVLAWQWYNFGPWCKAPVPTRETP